MSFKATDSDLEQSWFGFQQRIQCLHGLVNLGYAINMRNQFISRKLLPMPAFFRETHRECATVKRLCIAPKDSRVE